MSTSPDARYWSSGAVIASGVFVLLFFYKREVAQRLTAEDGVVEYGTALLYLGAAVLFVLATRKLRFRNVWLLGLALLCMAVAGEEISWGQRLFGVATPETLSDTNIQQEMNLHNIDGIHQYVRLVGAGIAGVLFFLIPMTDALVPRLRQLYGTLRVPVFPTSLTLVPLAALLFMVIPRVIFTSTIFAVDEFGEILLALAFLIYAIASRRQAAAVGTSVDHGDEGRLSRTQPSVASTPQPEAE